MDGRRKELRGGFGVRRGGDHFYGPQGETLYERWWRPRPTAGVYGSPPVTPRASVVILHGLKEHSGRYDLVGDRLARDGYAARAFDLLGHGNSEGRRCYVSRFDRYTEELASFLERVRRGEPEAPVFVLAHSMGGTVAVLLALYQGLDVRGLILSSPVLQPGEDVSPLLVRLSKVVGAVLPWVPAVRVDEAALSRDPAVAREVRRDPLVPSGNAPARTGAELLRAIELIDARIEYLSLPLLVLHGTADRLADPDGSRYLAENVSSGDVTLKLYEGFYHETLNDPERDRVVDDILRWLDARAEAPAPETAEEEG